LIDFPAKSLIIVCMSELSSGDAFDPNDAAQMDRFLAAADEFLAATAAHNADLANIKAGVDADIEQTNTDVVTVVRRHGVAHFPPEVDNLSTEHEPGEYTEEQLAAVEKARWLAANIVHLRDSRNITDPDEIRDIIGKAMVDIDDPEQSKAWLGVLKDIFQPYVNLDEILGPEPEVTVLQLVAAEEENIERRGIFHMRMVTIRSFVEELFREFGAHDDIEEVKRHIVFLSIIGDDYPNYQMRAILDLRSLIDAAKRFRPGDPDFLPNLREVINEIRTDLLDLPPIEEYLPPDWEQYLDDGDEEEQ
jgi:hypothetical protein